MKTGKIEAWLGRCGGYAYASDQEYLLAEAHAELATLKEENKELQRALLAYYHWDLTEIERCPECGTERARHRNGCSVQAAYRLARNLADIEAARGGKKEGQ